MRKGMEGNHRYGKWMRFAERVLFPLLLLLYPLLWADQGIDVSDPLYSLTNFRFFPELSGTWAIATYLANVAGFLLMKLPFGDTLLGISLYTRLIISAMALLSYFFLKGKMPAWAAFLGELLAVSFCWCPSTILYNYLTYALFLAGCILLYRGLIWNRNGLLVWAGVCLGLNVMVRTPNIAEAVLIAAVFYYGKQSGAAWKEMWRQTGLCVAGFLAGFLAVYALIAVQYGPTAYFDMFASLSAYSSTDATYSPLSMITSILSAYGSTLVWVMLLAVCALAGWIFFRVLPKRLVTAGKVVYCLCIPVLFRLFWGRGMFTFTYYNYRSMYEWGMLLLYLTAASCLAVLWDRRTFRRDRLLALIILLSVLVTPIGSNNGTMPSLNNLFLAAPFTLWTFVRFLGRAGKKKTAFPALALTGAVLLMTGIQGAGFRACFAFGDGIYGEKRDTKVENSVILKGMKTRQDNAQALEGLVGYVQNGASGVAVKENGGTAEERGAALSAPLSGRSLITFGNAPGLNFLLDMPLALSHGWPDLNTYPAEQMKEELAALAGEGSRPAVVVYKEQGSMPKEDAKWEALESFLAEGTYALLYENEGYRVYG